MQALAAILPGDRSELGKRSHHRPLPGLPITRTSVDDGFKLQRKAACACGGGCPLCGEDSAHLNVQTKLAVSTPGDQYEQEADRVAERVVQMKEAPCAWGGGCAGCAAKRERLVQRKLSAGPGEMSQSLPGDLAPGLGAGQTLDPTSRAFFEPRLGHDLSG